MFDIVSYIDIAGYITNTNERLQTHNDMHLYIRRAMTARTVACAPALLSLAAVVVSAGGLVEAGAHYENSHQYLEVDIDILDYEVREYDEFNLIRVELEVGNQEVWDIYDAKFVLGGMSDAGDSFSTNSEFYPRNGEVIRDFYDIDVSHSDCKDILPNLIPGSSGRISLCYIVGKTFEPSGLHVSQGNTDADHSDSRPPFDLYHTDGRWWGTSGSLYCSTGYDHGHGCSRRIQVVPFHADSSYCALYGSYCNSNDIQDVGSLPKPEPRQEPESLAHATLLYTLYNNNTGTLTMVFDRPVVAQNPGRIGLIHDIAAYIDGDTAPGLDDAELSTVDNKRQSAVLAFALSENMRLDVTESIRTYGDLALLIRSGAIYSADGFADVTAHTSAILVEDLVVVR